jgi:hypothetical protein
MRAETQRDESLSKYLIARGTGSDKQLLHKSLPA